MTHFNLDVIESEAKHGAYGRLPAVDLAAVLALVRAVRAALAVHPSSMTATLAAALAPFRKPEAESGQ